MQMKTKAPVIPTVLEGQLVRTIAPPFANDEPGVVFPHRTGADAFKVTYDQLSTGLLVLGGTGSGKSNNVYHRMIEHVCQNMGRHDVALIFDAKGVYYRQLVDSNYQGRIVLISSDPADSQTCAHWNIFEELLCQPREEIEVVAREFAMALFAAEIKSHQPFFGLAAAAVFNFVLIALLREASTTGDYTRLDNKALILFFKHAASDINVYHDLLDKYPDFGFIRTYIGLRGQGMTNQALGVLGVLNSVIEQVFFKSFAQSGRPFSMSRICKDRGAHPHGTVILMRFVPRHKSALETVLSLLVSQFIKETLSRPDDAEGQTFTFLDEFSMLPFVSNIQEAANYGRSKKLRLILGLQSVSQLEAKYDKEATPIMAGLTNCIAFRCTDEESRSFVSKRFGASFENYSFAGGNIQHNTYAVSDSDQRNLKVGEAFIDLPNHEPFWFPFKEFEFKHVRSN